MMLNYAFAAKLGTVVCAFMLLIAPAQAMKTEEIGKLTANFAGETITQPTVLVKGEEKGNTAFLFVQQAGFSSLSLAGYSADNSRLGIDVSYFSLQPTPETTPMDVTITYSPPRPSKGFWTSGEAPHSATITFTTFETNGNQGRVVGTYQAQLCRAESIGSEPDTDNCRPIEGTFDSRYFIEK